MRGGHSAASAGGRRAAASAQRSVAQATLQIAISEIETRAGNPYANIDPSDGSIMRV